MDLLAPSRSADDRCQSFLDRADQIRHNHVIAAVIELGAAAVDEFYDGEVARSYVRGPAADEPLAVLVERYGQRMEYLGLTVDKVRTAIRAWDVDRQLPPPSQGRLLPSQLRALAVIPSPADRARLANLAVAQGWSNQQTAAQVAGFRQENGLVGKGGRQPKAAQVRASNAALRELSRLGAVGDVEQLPVGVRVQLRKDLRALVELAEGWLKGLG